MLTRRNVLVTSAWAVPTIAVASAAPAFAASGTPVLSTAWNADSFRYSTNADGTGGTASASARAAIRVDVTVSGGTVDTLSCVLSTTGTVALQNNSTAVNRGSTSWATNNGSIAADGWTTSTTIPSGQATSFAFSRGSSGPGTYSLRLVVDSIATLTDFPFQFNFSSPDAALPSAVVATASVISPFITGAP